MQTRQITVTLDITSPPVSDLYGHYDILDDNPTSTLNTTPGSVVTVITDLVPSTTTIPTALVASSTMAPYQIANATGWPGPDIVASTDSIEGTPIEPSLEVINVAKIGQLTLGNLYPTPASPVGSIIDRRGMIRAGSTGLYYCTEDYTSSTYPVWEKLPFGARYNVIHSFNSRTMTMEDIGSYVRMNLASDGIYVVPNDDQLLGLKPGDSVTIRQGGEGAVTIASDGPIIYSPGSMITNGQHVALTLIYIGTNEWDLIGDVAPV